MKWYMSVWEVVKKWSYKWVGGLFLEEKKDGTLAVSLGRVSFLGILGYMINIWEHWKPMKVDVPALLEALKGAEALTQDAVGAAMLQATSGMPDMETMPPGLMQVFYILAGYIFGSKAVGALKAKWSDKATM